MSPSHLATSLAKDTFAAVIDGKVDKSTMTLTHSFRLQLPVYHITFHSHRLPHHADLKLLGISLSHSTNLK